MYGILKRHIVSVLWHRQTLEDRSLDRKNGQSQCSSPGKQETNVHLEVRWRSAWTVMPLLYSPSSPPSSSSSSSFPIPVTKRASLVARETGFFRGDVETRGKGRAALFHPRDEGFSPCMFNRQTYGPKPNSRAHPPQPDYVQWSFWHRHFASFITLRSSHHGHLSYCCTGLLMSAAETTDSQTKQWKAHMCLCGGNWNMPGQINTLSRNIR